MPTAPHERLHSSLTRFLLRQTGRPSHELMVRTRALRGGLDSDVVLHVSVWDAASERGRQRSRFVVKRLRGDAVREAQIHEAVRATSAGALAPVLLGVDRDEDVATSLYLEAIERASRWPWSDVRQAQRVLENLAELHMLEVTPELALIIGAWDYHAELLESAQRTLARAECAARDLGDPGLRRSLPMLRGVVAALPSAYRDLVSAGPLAAAVLHGDMHSGNVLLRKRAGLLEPVFLDWARARIGSPLEDVTSWLQSLAAWEPEIRRKHDTLLAAYLAARGLPSPPSNDVRDAYWLAAACNALAGALDYHLQVATNRELTRRRRQAAQKAAHEWLRVIRRAHARQR